MKGYHLLSIIVIFIFSACGGIEYKDNNVAKRISNIVVDDIIEGFSYHCSSSINEYLTTSEGNYSCNVDDNITFKLGKNRFKSFKIKDEIVTPYTIFPDSLTSALNLARLLQALDKDKNVSKITIDKKLEALLPDGLDYTDKNFEEKIQNSLSLKLINANEAQKKMNSAIIEAGGEISTDASTVPVADAGVDQNSSSKSITLDGSKSIAYKYLWRFTSKPSNSRALIMNSSSIKPSFEADIEGTYVVELIVNSDDINSISDSVTIVIKLNNSDKEPLANAGVDQKNIVGSLINLDSNGSIATTYNWAFLSKPSDSNTTLSNKETEKSFFVADVEGTYVVELVVDQETQKSDLDVVKVIIAKENNATQVLNTAPEITSYDEININENSTDVIQISAIDKENDKLTYSISGVDSEDFIINADNGEIRFKKSPDYETKKYYEIVVIVNDDRLTDTQKLKINILDVNEYAPILVDTTLSMLESYTIGNFVGRLTISDNGGTAITSISLSGNDSDKFSIDNNGSLRVDTNDSFDFETKKEYNLTAVAINNIGNSNVVNILIYVNNVIDEVPILKDSNSSVNENILSGVEVAKINIFYTGDSNITSIKLRGDDSGKFNVSTDGNVTLDDNASLDYEKKKSYHFEVVAKNSVGDSNIVNLDIKIKNLPEVAILEDKTFSIIENAIAGDKVGTITTKYGADSEITDINLTGIGSKKFKTLPTGEIFLANGAILDYETKNRYSLSAVATNDAGKSEDVNITILIKDYINNPFEIAKIVSNDIERGDHFGSSVAINGTYIVVGAKDEDTDGLVSSGSVYLFRKNYDDTISQIAKIKASDAQENDNFGNSVAIYNNIIVVGALNEDTTADNAGSIYVYKIDSNGVVSQLKKLQASDAQENDNFGKSVAIDGNYIVVGADKEDRVADDSGSVYIFKIDDLNISEFKIIKASDAEFNDNFGNSVDISETYIIVGSYKEDSEATNSGSAYLFKILSDDVKELKKIVSNDAEDSDFFGCDVAIDGKYIVIGAYGEDSIASNAGSAYLFKIETDTSISQITKINSNDADSGDYFSYSVDIDGKYISIGSYLKDSSQEDSGSGYVFEIDGSDVKQLSKIVANDSAQNDLFGNSIAIYGDYVVVGAYTKNSNTHDTGAVYIFNMEPIDKIYLYNIEKTSLSLDEGIKKKIFSIDSLSPNGFVSYSLEGIDESLFKIIDSNLLNIKKFNYENPLDIDEKNDYNLTILISDSTGNEKKLDIDVKIKDKYYLELEKLGANDAQVDDRFGEAVDITDKYIVVSSPYADSEANNAGAVYLFKKDNNSSNISFFKKIQPNNLKKDDFFGNAVSIYNNYMVVGAYKSDSDKNNVGSVYLFEIKDDSVDELIKLQPENLEENDFFGTTVSIDSNYIVVGTPDKNSSTGKVYLYKIEDNNSITKLSEILPNDLNISDRFGCSVSIDKKIIAVGANNSDSNGSTLGSVYLFKIDDNDSVSKLSKLNGSGINGGDKFGSSVDIDSNYIVVGSPYNDTIAVDAGKVYLFKINDDNISEITSFQATDIGSNNHFGSSVAIDNMHIMVGAFGEDVVGSIYVYNIDNNDSLTEEEKLLSGKYDENDYFGSSVAIDGEYVIVGSHNEDTSTLKDIGKAYLYIKD